MPSYAPRKLTSAAPKSKPHPVREGTRAPGKVAIFATCYVNYNEPGIGRDLLKILEHNEIPYTFVEDEVCCGMPKLELGDLAAVEKLKARNIPLLVDLARAGHAILTPVPSCTLMKIGKPVFRRMAETEPDFVCSDCPIAGSRIAQGMKAEGSTVDAQQHRARKEHPLTLLRMAYGL